ncbi:MAG: hypothetical protein JRI45_08210 [Deltaproteobacteria bacterium]|nr:hypothetical protein [Deltaproteobacteria bacterium]
MRCPKCHYISFDYLDKCKKCGADLTELKRQLLLYGWNREFSIWKWISKVEETDRGMQDYEESYEESGKELTLDLTEDYELEIPIEEAEETSETIKTEETIEATEEVLPGEIEPEITLERPKPLK